MINPGGVLHAALRVALRRSQECFARGVVPQQAWDDKSPTVPSPWGPEGGKKIKRKDNASDDFED